MPRLHLGLVMPLEGCNSSGFQSFPSKNILGQEAKRKKMSGVPEDDKVPWLKNPCQDCLDMEVV